MESWALHNSVSYMTSSLFLKLFFRGSQGLCLWACLYGRQRLFVGVFASVALRLTSPLWPTLMKAHIGWKAPVPQARRWVRLWGCRRRTKFAHSVCGTQKRGHSLKPRVSKKYGKRYILYAALPTSTLSEFTNILGTVYQFLYLQFPQPHKNKLAQLMGKGQMSVEEV